MERNMWRTNTPKHFMTVINTLAGKAGTLIPEIGSPAIMQLPVTGI